MKFLVNLLLITAIFLNIPVSLGAQEVTSERDVIRVGLSNSGFSTFEFSETTIITSDISTLSDMSNGAQIKDIPRNTEILAKMVGNVFFIIINGKEVVKNAKGPILIVSNGKLGVKNLNRKGNPAYYRGMIELQAAHPGNKGKFNIINVLDTQTYLKGVVPNEMPVSFGLNALKAQAVAARNYANRPQNVYKNYDICDSTACQVYYGANSENPLSDKAVEETQGIFALYNKEPVLALYSSTGGGITEDYECVYGSGNSRYNPKPFLKSVKDNNSVKTPKTEEELKEFYTKNVPSFDMKSPKHRWEVNFSRFELEEILTKTLREQSAKGLVYPIFGENDEVWGLEDIWVSKRGDSGKAIEVEIRSMGGTWRVKKELGIRRVFKKGKSILWSGNFVVEKNMPQNVSENGEEKILNPKTDDMSLNDKKIQENNHNSLYNKENTGTAGILENNEPKKAEPEAIFTFLKPENKEPSIGNPEIKVEDGKKIVYKNRLGSPLPLGFTFFGAGFGHGVGMSQYGAGYLASQGVGYDVILKHYYTGIALGTMPREVAYNNYNQNYVQNLYVDNINSTTAGTLANGISENPLKEEITELYNASKASAKYVLNIDNSKNPAEIEFYINELHFNQSMKGFYGKILKMDITKYLKKGKNTITFMPLKAADKEKTTSFWVEIEK